MIRKASLSIMIILLLLLPFVYADLIMPGEKGITIKNIVTNIADYPGYTFIQIGYLGDRIGSCTTNKLGDNGQITTGYKFCSYSIYAVPKENFNDSSIDMLLNGPDAYLSSSNAVKVADKISGYTTVATSGVIDSITRYYTVSLSSEASVKTVYGYNANLYIYIIVAVAVLAGIIYLVMRKR